MAFTGIAAIAAGTVTAVSVTAAIVEVGLVLTAVGAVTGSRDLMKIGGIMSAIGGIGGAIAGSTAAGGAAAAAAGGAESVAADAALSEALGGAFTEGVGSSFPVTEFAGAGSDAIGGTIGNAAASGVAPVAAMAPQPAAVHEAAQAVAPSTTNTGLGAVAPQGVNGPAAITTPATPADSRTFFGKLTDTLGEAWSGAGDRTKSEIIKTGSGFLQGLASSKNTADQNALQREALHMRYGYANSVPKGIIGSGMTGAAA